LAASRCFFVHDPLSPSAAFLFLVPGLCQPALRTLVFGESPAFPKRRPFRHTLFFFLGRGSFSLGSDPIGASSMPKFFRTA